MEGKGTGQRSLEKARSVHWVCIRGPGKPYSGCRSAQDRVTQQLGLKKGLQLNILPARTLLGVMFPGWSFPSFWIKKPTDSISPSLVISGRWQASRDCVQPPPERKPQSLKFTCHTHPPPTDTTTQTPRCLHSTSPPSPGPSWVPFHLLSSLDPEMSVASKTSKSCSFQQGNSLDANQTSSSAPEN